MKAACLILPLLGCVDTTPTPLASLPDRQLHVGAASDGMVVSLSWDDTSTEDDCPVLRTSFRATANSMLLEVVMNDYITADTWCLRSPLQFETFLPVATSKTMLTIQDDSLAITADLGDLALRRTGTLAGDTIAFDTSVLMEWFPVSDLLDYTPRVFVDQDGSVYEVPATIDDTGFVPRVQFSIPADGRFVAGVALLRVQMNDDTGVLPCTNAQCTLAAVRGETRAITLQ